MSPTASPRLSPALQQTLWALGFTTADAALPTAQLTAFVRHHGVAGLLDSQRLAALDEASRQALARERRQIALRALQLGGALKRLCDALQAQGLEPLALKGPALALQAHGTLAARGGVDLDIFIEQMHWPRTLQALRELGYQPAAGQSLPLARGTHELVLQHSQGQPRVELHRRLLRHHSSLQGNYTSVDLLDTKVSCLTPASALPYLVAHANQHCFRRLIWLLDIHALLLHPQLDAQAAADQFVNSGTCGSLDACLNLLTRLFDSPIPAELQAVRRPCRASRSLTALALEAIEQSWSDDQVVTQQGLQSRVMLDLLLRDHWQLRWRALRDWLSPTATDHHWLQLPNSLRLLYPLVRLYRLIARSR